MNSGNRTGPIALSTAMPPATISDTPGHACRTKPATPLLLPALVIAAPFHRRPCRQTKPLPDNKARVAERPEFLGYNAPPSSPPFSARDVFHPTPPPAIR